MKKTMNDNDGGRGTSERMVREGFIEKVTF